MATTSPKFFQGFNDSEDMFVFKPVTTDAKNPKPIAVANFEGKRTLTLACSDSFVQELVKKYGLPTIQEGKYLQLNINMEEFEIEGNKVIVGINDDKIKRVEFSPKGIKVLGDMIKGKREVFAKKDIELSLFAPKNLFKHINDKPAIVTKLPKEIFQQTYTNSLLASLHPRLYNKTPDVTVKNIPIGEGIALIEIGNKTYLANVEGTTDLVEINGFGITGSSLQVRFAGSLKIGGKEMSGVRLDGLSEQELKDSKKTFKKFKSLTEYPGMNIEADESAKLMSPFVLTSLVDDLSSTATPPKEEGGPPVAMPVEPPVATPAATPVATPAVTPAETPDLADATPAESTETSFSSMEFNIPVKGKDKEGKEIVIGQRVNTYGAENGVFTYGAELTKSGKPLMTVKVESKDDGKTYSKTLEINNEGHEFDYLKNATEDTGIKVEGDKITIPLKEFKYNPTTLITASLETPIMINDKKYNSIDVLAQSIVLKGSPGFGKDKTPNEVLYRTKGNEIINQKLPKDFFTLFSQTAFKGEKLPAQQLEALLKISPDNLPKGVATKEYKLGGKDVRTLTLDYVDPNAPDKTKKWLFMQIGDEVKEINNVYTVTDPPENGSILFGTDLSKTKGKNSLGKNKEVYEIKKFNSEDPASKAFLKDIGVADVEYKEFDSIEKAKAMVTPRGFRNNKLKTISAEAKVAEGVKQQPQNNPPLKGAGGSEDGNKSKPKKKRSLWKKVLKFGLMALVTAAFIGFGAAMLVSGVGSLFMGSFFLGCGFLAGVATVAAIVDDQKKAAADSLKQAAEDMKIVNKAKVDAATKEKSEELKSSQAELKEIEQKNAYEQDLIKRGKELQESRAEILKLIEENKRLAALAAATTSTDVEKPLTTEAGRPEASGAPVVITLEDSTEETHTP